MSPHPIGRATRIALLAWTALLVLVGGMIWERLDAVRAGHAWVDHTEKVVLTIKDLEIALRDIQSGQRGYLLTGDEQQLQAYENSLGTIGFQEGELQRLTADNPRQLDRLRVLAPLIARRLETIARVLQVRRDSGPDAALRLLRERDGDSELYAIDRQVQTMAGEEQTLLALRLHSTMARSNRLSVMALVGAVLVVLVLLWTGRALNAAWLRAAAMEARQRTLAERLSASLDSLSQGVAVFDADRRMTNWNPCLTALLNLPDGMGRPGLPYADLAAHLAEENAMPDLLESDEQVRRSGPQAPGETVTYERTRPDGQHLEVRRTPMRGGGFVLTVSDMTKRMQAEAGLREAQKMQAIGQLTGGIAHDFNNLLTVILGNLDALQSSPSNDPATQKRIDRAVWAAQRGATLTAQLLAFARKQPLAPAPLDLSRTVPELVPLLQRTLGAPIDFRFVIEGGVGAAGLWPAMADAAQLESALLNLALNARDAMPNGGCLTLELANTVLDSQYARTHAEVTAGDYVMLAVSDTGYGMSPAVIASAFEPFFTTKPDGNGTGLGLAMVFGFVKQSKGHVKIYSEIGEGTAIKLYLPRAAGGIPPIPPSPISASPIPRVTEPMRSAARARTILVVEDEFDVREVAVSILTDYGYQVLEAGDGEEALRVFEAHSAAIDLLLTDVVLPGPLRGRDIAARVTASRPGVRVLFMSGYTENSIVHNGRLDDGVHLIGKPFTRDQLAAKVTDLLDQAPVLTPPANSDQRAG